MFERNYALTFGITAQTYSYCTDNFEIQISIRPKRGNYLIEGKGSLTNFIDPDSSNSSLFDISVSYISSETQIRYPPNKISEDFKNVCCTVVTSAISESESDTKEKVKKVLSYLQKSERC